MIEVNQLAFDYPGTRAVDNVSFSIAPLSVTALVGPNGAGKTALLRSLEALSPKEVERSSGSGRGAFLPLRSVMMYGSSLMKTS